MLDNDSENVIVFCGKVVKSVKSVENGKIFYEPNTVCEGYSTCVTFLPEDDDAIIFTIGPLWLSVKTKETRKLLFLQLGAVGKFVFSFIILQNGRYGIQYVLLITKEKNSWATAFW